MKSKFNVLFFAGWYPSREDPVSGIFVKEHAKASSIYNDLVVVTNNGIERDLNDWSNIEDNIEDGLRTIRVSYRKSPIPKSNYLVYLWTTHKAFRYLEKSGFEPDIIHANVSSAAVPAALLGELYDLPLVITEHFSGFGGSGLSGLTRMKASFVLNRANLILPVSDYLAKLIRENGFGGKFKVIPNAVDMEVFYPDYKKNRKGKKRILMVGLLSPVKGLPTLLRAVKKMSKVRSDFALDVVGDGPQREEYESLASRLGVDHLINFKGLSSREEVADYMRESDLFVLPSKSETFGAVIIEALASGLPVVSTASGGPNEIVNEEVGKLVPPGDSEVLAKTLGNVLDNLGEFSNRRIRRYAKDNFSLERVGEMFNSAYEEVFGTQ